MILHLVLRKEWESSPLNQPFVPQAFAKDGFIHCTQGLDALLTVANMFYRTQPGEFVALEIDETRVKSEVRWEAPAPQPPTPPAQPPQVVEGNLPLPPEVLAEYGSMPEPVTAPAAAQPTPAPVPEIAGPALPTQFPHIYGPLNRDAITGIRIAVRDQAGAFTGFTQAFKPDDRTQTMRAADDLLKATDDFSESLSRYKDRIKSQMDDLDEQIKKGLP